MVDIIETHVKLTNFESFQSRIITYESFEKYIDDIKYKKCEIMNDKYGKCIGYSRSPKLDIQIIKEEIEDEQLVFDMDCFNGLTRCFCQIVHTY